MKVAAAESHRFSPITVPEDDRANVVRLRDALRGVPRRYELRRAGGDAIAVPEAVLHLMRCAVEVLAAGDAVMLAPIGRELTTQQAANLLNVSRQYLVRLLGEGKLPYTRTGSHRRLRIEDVLRFKEERDRARAGGLAELTQLHEDLGGYDG